MCSIIMWFLFHPIPGISRISNNFIWICAKEKTVSIYKHIFKNIVVKGNISFSLIVTWIICCNDLFMSK